MTETAEREDAVWVALAEVLDPCMAAGGHRVSVVDLGLITRVNLDSEGVEIGITFTEVGCPFTHRVIDRIESTVLGLGFFKSVRVTPEWQPGWTPERMNKVALNALQSGRQKLGRHFQSAITDNT